MTQLIPWQDGADAPILVAGMVWLMVEQRRGETLTDAVLTGPAVGAAMGVRACNQSTEMLIAVPDSGQPGWRRLLSLLDPVERLWTTRREPPLRWIAPPVIGESRSWKLEGDPRKWIATCDPYLLSGRVLTLANGSPSAYADLLEKASPRWVAMDIDACWAASQSLALNRCVRRVNLVTITRRDYEELPSQVLAGTKAGQPGGAALIIKAGATGIMVNAQGETRLLPAPAVSGEVKTDVGAGDFLLGILSAHLGPRCISCSVEEIECAYWEACPLLVQLLECNRFTGFADSLLQT
jgi:hypothetical protein